MSTATEGLLGLVDVEAAVTLAGRAPSIHNTQPWRWELRGGVLELLADRSRQLGVADPDGHSLMLSCGAALALTELALRARGWRVTVDRLPEPDLVARLHGVDRVAPLPADLDLVVAARARRSERRPFGAAAVSTEQVERLRQATASSRAYVHFPARTEEALELAVTVSHADRVERQDPAYLAEMARWVHADPGSGDGVPATVVPRVEAGTSRHTDVPLRDFEVGVPGGQLITAGVDEKPLLAVVLTDGDQPADEVAAGEVMLRLMLEAELAGLSCCPLSQAVDMPVFRRRLKTLMGWPSYPQMMLRLGSRPSGTPAPLTRRRPLAEVFRSR